MAHDRLVLVCGRISTGVMAIAFALVLGGGPATFAQDSIAPHHGKPAAPGPTAEQRSTQDEQYAGAGSEAAEPAGMYVAVPIGRVKVGPEFMDGEPVYVRRTRNSAGMTIVEGSTTPFMPDLGWEASADYASINNPSMYPAPW